MTAKPSPKPPISKPAPRPQQVPFAQPGPPPPQPPFAQPTK